MLCKRSSKRSLLMILGCFVMYDIVVVLFVVKKRCSSERVTPISFGHHRLMSPSSHLGDAIIGCKL